MAAELALFCLNRPAFCFFRSLASSGKASNIVLSSHIPKQSLSILSRAFEEYSFVSYAIDIQDDDTMIVPFIPSAEWIITKIFKNPIIIEIVSPGFIRLYDTAVYWIICEPDAFLL